MGTFLRLLHILAAILIIGPLAFAPFYGLQGIKRRDATAVRMASKWTWWFGLGSVLTALLGAAVVGTSDRYTFGTPWIIISGTLYAVMLILALLWARPTLGKGAKLLETGTFELPAPPAEEGEPATPEMLDATGLFLTTKTRLDGMVGRIGAAAGVNLLLIVAVVVLMTLRPFGT